MRGLLRSFTDALLSQRHYLFLLRSHLRFENSRVEPQGHTLTKPPRSLGALLAESLLSFLQENRLRVMLPCGRLKVNPRPPSADAPYIPLAEARGLTPRAIKIVLNLLIYQLAD